MSRGAVVKSNLLTKVHCYSNSQTGVLSYRMWSLVQQLPQDVMPIIDDYVFPPDAPRLQVREEACSAGTHTALGLCWLVLCWARAASGMMRPCQ